MTNPPIVITKLPSGKYILRDQETLGKVTTKEFSAPEEGARNELFDFLASYFEDREMFSLGELIEDFKKEREDLVSGIEQKEEAIEELKNFRDAILNKLGRIQDILYEKLPSV